ncbi:MAG: lipopolysaccharide biosynthesis protein [Candidatus Zhuqueibacterota bacterium]
MIEHFKRLSSQTLVYGLGDAVIKAIAFFLIPLYTRLLSQEQVGIISLLNLVEVFLWLLLSLSLNSAVFKVYHDYTSESERNVVFSSAVLFTAAVAFPLLLVLFFNAGLVSEIIFRNPDNAVYLKILFGSVFFNLFRLLALAYLRTLEKPVLYSMLNTLHFTLLVGFNILHVLILRQGILGVVKSSLYTSAILFLVVMIVVFRKTGLAFSATALKKLLHFGLPMVPGSVANYLLTMSDRYLLNIYSSADQVGLYDIAYKFGMIIQMVLVMPFRTAWLPFVFSVQKKPEAKSIYAGAVTYFLLAAVFLFLALTFFIKEIIINFSTAAYLPGMRAIPYIAMSYIFFGLYYIVDIGVLLKSKTIFYTLIATIGAAINITLNIVFIPGYGMIAAAINTAISYLFILIFMYIVSSRLYRVNYEKARIVKIVTVGIALYLIGTFVPESPLGMSIILKVGLLISYPILLYTMKFFRHTEIAGYKKLIQEVINRKGRSIHGQD